MKRLNAQRISDFSNLMKVICEVESAILRKEQLEMRGKVWSAELVEGLARQATNLDESPEHVFLWYCLLFLRVGRQLSDRPLMSVRNLEDTIERLFVGACRRVD